MFKHVDVGSWDFGIKVAEVIPVSSRGLTASDSNSFFSKRAGEHRFKEILDGMKLAKDEIPIHLVAMGCTEIYGANKNFDGFKEAMLKRDHPTFVTNGHVFYHHKNDKPKEAFGKVAASLYNDDMGRVELLILLNGSKEVAEKNGGLVAPKEDVDALYEGRDVPFSMGITIGHDACAACNNKAASPKEYCEEHECIDEKGIQRFGCRHGLGKTAEDGFTQFVDNPSGKFKDISRVSSPADRTAYGAIAKYAAAAGTAIGGAELALARGNYEQEHYVKQAELQIYSDTLSKLASFESSLQPVPDVISRANGFKVCDELPTRVSKYAKATHEQDKCSYLMQLADHNIVLSPRQFAKFAGFSTSDAYVSVVKGMFGQLDRAHDNRLGLLSECKKYACSRRTGVPPYFAAYRPENFYTTQGDYERALTGSMYRDVNTKTAAEPIEADYKAAIEYCLYKVAAVTRMNDDIHYITACLQNF